MTLQETKDCLVDIAECLLSVPECADDVVTFNRAIQFLEYVPRLANALDLVYTLASRHYQSGAMEEINLLLKDIFYELRDQNFRIMEEDNE